MEWRYSRQDSEGDQGDGEAEDGDGAANISDGGQRRLVASSELRRETESSVNSNNDHNNIITIHPIHLSFLFTI